MEALTDALIQHLQDNGLDDYIWKGALVLVCWTVVTAILTRWFSTRRIISQIRREGIEEKLKNGDVIERIEKSRTDLSAKSESINMFLSEIRDALKSGDKKRLHEVREETCRTYSIDYLDQLRRYVEDIKIFCDHADALDRVIIDILPALDTIKRFLDVINSEKILSKLDYPSKYRLDPNPQKIFFRKISRLVPPYRIPTKIQIQRISKSMKKHLRDD